MTILMADPRITRIPVREVDEPVVDLSTLAPHAAGIARFARVGVVQRLRAAQATLPVGIRVSVVEASRSSEQQRSIIDAYADDLRASYPEATAREIERLTSRHVAPLGAAPHVAGAAVDLTLVDQEGTELWMGCALDATPEQSRGACYTEAPGLDRVARENRALLREALEPTGLVNYPTEWWHWSFGDRYWAHAVGADHALYGPLPMAAAA